MHPVLSEGKKKNCAALEEFILRLLRQKQTRAFAAVLFRRIATKARKDAAGEAKEVFLTLPNEQRVVIREKLVTCLSTESVTDVRKKIGDAVAEIARQYTDNGPRPLRNT